MKCLNKCFCFLVLHYMLIVFDDFYAEIILIGNFLLFEVWGYLNLSSFEYSYKSLKGKEYKIKLWNLFFEIQAFKDVGNRLQRRRLLR